MIAYVDTPPMIEPLNGGFLMTLKSGDEQINIMLTPHAAFYLEQRIRKAKAEGASAALGKEPIPFKSKPGKR